MRQTPLRVVHKTASYSINPAVDRLGTLFTNGGATGAVTFTLCRPTRALLGGSYEFAATADQAIPVSALTAGDIVTKDDAAANSVAASTAGEQVGARISAECVETSLNSGVFKWLVTGLSVGHTFTVTT